MLVIFCVRRGHARFTVSSSMMGPMHAVMMLVGGAEQVTCAAKNLPKYGHGSPNTLSPPLF
jgi:hypothetical protein